MPLSVAVAPLLLAASAAEAAPRVPPLAPVVVTAPRVEEDTPLAGQARTADQLQRTVNAVTAEDSLRYLPNLFVRRRHIGDTQAPITTRTSGVGASARSLIYADGVLLSALIGNNNTIASPRWSMVGASEIAQVRTAYGPFDAAFPGNSVGAVVQITTREPQGFEARAEATLARQSSRLYGQGGSYVTRVGTVGLGDRRGPFWWRLNYTRLESAGQPLSYVTAVRPPAPSGAGLSVSGAALTLNRIGQPIAVVGAGGLERQDQDLAKLKITADLGGAEVSYLLGYFGQQDRAPAQSFLTDPSGKPVYASASGVQIGGYAYPLPASAFATGVYRWDETHWMQALTVKGAPSARLSWSAIASAYDFTRDAQRFPSGLPSGFAGGPGTVTDLSGTGWRTGDLQVNWRGAGSDLRAGLHLDRYELRSRAHSLADWRTGRLGPLTAVSLGKTETRAAWADDRLDIGGGLDLQLGARLERWRAFDGFNANAAPPLAAVQPSRRAQAVSPKAVLSWRGGPWRASLSLGQAYRFPTVSELYQSVRVGPDQRTPSPDLAPERARSTELSLDRAYGSAGSHLRASLFAEDVRNALISQTTQLAGGSGPSVSFVQNVPATRARGAELVWDAHDLGVDGLDLSASATWVDARVHRDPAFAAAEGKRLPQVARVRWTAVATWRASERLSLTAAGRYSDRVFATLDNSDRVTHTYTGFDPYLVVDARAAFKLERHWWAALGVDNLTDRRYFLFHPFPGRTIVAQLTYAIGDRQP